eukprot:9976983-Ditylum_brightwellii.AAC.1
MKKEPELMHIKEGSRTRRQDTRRVEADGKRPIKRKHFTKKSSLSSTMSYATEHIVGCKSISRAHKAHPSLMWMYRTTNSYG